MELTAISSADLFWTFEHADLKVLAEVQITTCTLLSKSAIADAAYEKSSLLGVSLSVIFVALLSFSDDSIFFILRLWKFTDG